MTDQPKTAPAEEWTARQCAEHIGVKPSTWRAYVARGQAPRPSRYLDQRTPLWSAAEVRAWDRPRQAARAERNRAQNTTTESEEA